MTPLGRHASVFGLLAVVVATALMFGGRRPEGSATASALDPTVMAVIPFEAAVEGGAPLSMQMGIPEMLTVRLSLVPGLTVRPLSRVLDLGPRRHDPVKAGRALGALGVLSGDYSRRDGAFHARVRLIDVETGAVAWTHDVRFAGDDPPAFEEAVAREVVEILMDQRQEPLPAGQLLLQEDPTARYLRLVGSGSIASLDTTLAHESIVLLEAAMSTSPASASVNATLAEACAGLVLGGVSTDAAWLNRARALAQRAVWLDPDAAAGHLALGRVLRLQGLKVESARSAVEALRRDPSNGLAIRLLGFLVAGCDDVGLLRETIDRLQHLSPGTDPGWLQFALAVREGTVASLMERVREDLDLKQRAGASQELPLTYLGMLAVETRDTATVLQTTARLDASGRPSALSDSLRLHALALMGDVRGMQRLVDANRESYTSQDEQAIWVALAWAVAGRRAEALEWVDRGARLGSVDAWTLDQDPRFAALRDEPVFRQAAASVRARAGEIQRVAREVLQQRRSDRRTP